MLAVENESLSQLLVTGHRSMCDTGDELIHTQCISYTESCVTPQVWLISFFMRNTMISNIVFDHDLCQILVFHVYLVISMIHEMKMSFLLHLNDQYILAIVDLFDAVILTTQLVMSHNAG